MSILEESLPWLDMQIAGRPKQLSNRLWGKKLANETEREDGYLEIYFPPKFDVFKKK